MSSLCERLNLHRKRNCMLQNVSFLSVDSDCYLMMIVMTIFSTMQLVLNVVTLSCWFCISYIYILCPCAILTFHFIYLLCDKMAVLYVYVCIYVWVTVISWMCKNVIHQQCCENVNRKLSLQYQCWKVHKIWTEQTRYFCLYTVNFSNKFVGAVFCISNKPMCCCIYISMFRKAGGKCTNVFVLKSLQILFSEINYLSVFVFESWCYFTVKCLSGECRNGWQKYCIWLDEQN